MISICIPVYNYDVSNLLNALVSQSKRIKLAIEIILIDDGSTENTQWNRPVSDTISYIDLKENIGRSRIRNLFLEYAKYDFLLFLDCDALICSDNFILTYLHAIKTYPDYKLFCGGRVYRKLEPDRAKLLRWTYGKYRESQPVEIRERYPNKSFMSNNFLIQKQTFLKNLFDERISTYGHEDTLFGYHLKKNNIDVKHIDNPILNGDLETNAEYLMKTEAALINLVHIAEYVNHDPEFIKSVSLLKFYNKLQSKKLIPFIKAATIVLNPFIKKRLLAGNVNLKLFDFYKLGVFTIYKNTGFH